MAARGIERYAHSSTAAARMTKPASITRAVYQLSSARRFIGAPVVQARGFRYSDAVQDVAHREDLAALIAARDAKRGLLIAFEGPEGSGKTTQRRLLKTWLRSEGRDVVTSRWASSRLVKPLIKARKRLRVLTAEEYSLLHAIDFRHRLDTVDPARALGRQDGDRGSLSLHRPGPRRRARPRARLAAAHVRPARLARPGRVFRAGSAGLEPPGRGHASAALLRVGAGRHRPGRSSAPATASSSTG